MIAVLEQSLSSQNMELPPDAIDADSARALCGADFLQELERRSAALRSGSTTARLVEDAMADLRRRQAGEAAV